MKLKVKKTVTEEVEVDFPIYLSYGENIFVMVVNENNLIHVFKDSCVQKMSIVQDILSDEDYSKSNSDEFDNAFESTLLTLKTLV